MKPLIDFEEIRRSKKRGPLGLGRPEDQSLDAFERNRVLPAFRRDIINREYCGQPDEEYEACCKLYRWTNKLRCRKELAAMKSCVDKYWHFPGLTEQTTQEYLEERKIFRRTGLAKSERDQQN